MSWADITIRNTAIATFETSLLNESAYRPLKELTLPITPSQSFNGYEYPWPAGGGKNILPTNRADIISRNTDGTWAGNKYTLNGVVFTFAYNTGGALLSVHAKGTASAVTVVPLSSGIDLKTNVGYTITGCPAGGSSSTYELMLSYATDTSGGFILHTYAAGGTYTPTEDMTAGVRILVRSGAEIDATYFPMVRLATVTDATFEPYSNICPITGYTGTTVRVSPTTDAGSGTAYPVSWQTEAGTVYCGSVDVVSGTLTVTHKSVTFDGTENWNWGTNYGGFAAISISDMKSGSWYSDSNTKCDTFPKISGNAYGVMVGNNNNRMIFRYMGNIPGVTDGDTWKAWLSSNNVTVTYPLATPLVYDLTPTAINTLLGVNNVWGDIGDIGTLVFEVRVFDQLRVLIDGVEITDYIAYNGLKRSRNDIDSPDSGRTLDGLMHRVRVATKLRWDVTCRPLKADELALIERLIMPVWISVTIVGDAYYGTWTRTCYANNTAAEYLIRKPDGDQYWGGVTFPLIER